MLLSSDINLQSHNIEPPLLIDEQTSTEYYIGTSRNNNHTDRPYWRIKKIWKDGTVWKIQFPDGNQGFSFIWDNRLLYTYS